jgi:hypothetical protein
MHLLLARSGLSWPELCQEFGINPAFEHDRRWMQLQDCLFDLTEATLLSVDEIPAEETFRFIQQTAMHFLYKGEHVNDDRKFHMRIRVSDNWRKIQRVLGVRLPPTSVSEHSFFITVQPLFERPRDLRIQSDIFVLMPFNEALKAIYDDHISKVARELNLSAMRADDLFTNNFLISDIWAGIFHAVAIVADCTGRNPNVFYEIGIAHTLGKPVILITQNTEDVPADLRYIKYIKYEYTPRGMSALEAALANTLKSIIAP